VHNQQVRRKYFRQCIRNSWICDRHLPALDIGCGPGSITRELKKYGFNPFSIDISYQMLINNRQNTGSVVKQSQCSADAICYKDNSFDVVTAAGVLEYVANDQRMLGEIMRVLKPGGMLIISVPTKFVISTSVRSTVGK
jgi:ubiquinone/menaquinone biosynthesis C-methylase UbiE